jgi:hypothetical protein
MAGLWSDSYGDNIEQRSVLPGRVCAERGAQHPRIEALSSSHQMNRYHRRLNTVLWMQEYISITVLSFLQPLCSTR